MHLASLTPVGYDWPRQSQMPRLFFRRKWKLTVICLLMFIFLTMHIGKRVYHYFCRTGDFNTSIEVLVEGFTPFDVTCDEYLPPKWNLTVVLLQEDTIPQSWVSLQTPLLLKEAGYRVVSLTLPAFDAKSLTNGVKVVYPIKGQILYDTLAKIKATDSVIVVPSVTGSYGLPVVLRGGLPLAGFVAIAPIDTEYFTPKEFALLDIPSLVVLGSYDYDVGKKSLEKLNFLKKKEVFAISNAGHECYIEKPNEFHKYLLRFLGNLNKR